MSCWELKSFLKSSSKLERGSRQNRFLGIGLIGANQGVLVDLEGLTIYLTPETKPVSSFELWGYSSIICLF